MSDSPQQAREKEKGETQRDIQEAMARASARKVEENEERKEVRESNGKEEGGRKSENQKGGKRGRR